MSWVVGIDEAGYGPNLGPLVQSAIALRLPEHDLAGWETLRPLVRRHGEKAKADHRVLIDDSKLVHQGKQGLAKLEAGVLAWLGCRPRSLHDFLREVALPHRVEDAVAEPWFVAEEPVPLHTMPITDVRSEVGKLGVECGPAVVNLVQPKAFNQIVAGSGSKATVLSTGVMELISTISPRLGGTDPVMIHCDKIGGRNSYSAILQAAFPDGRVVTECETAEEGRYRVEGLDRQVSAVFAPRADRGSLPVALASMLAKYLREVCMKQWNTFWQKQIPDLTPTAGYPQDAKRYYAAIEGVMMTLGMQKDHVWRCR